MRTRTAEENIEVRKSARRDRPSKLKGSATMSVLDFHMRSSWQKLSVGQGAVDHFDFSLIQPDQPRSLLLLLLLLLQKIYIESDDCSWKTEIVAENRRTG